MNYQEAFKTLINRYGMDALKDGFFVRSFLLDSVNKTPDNINLVEAYYSLNKVAAFPGLLLSMNLDECKAYIKLSIQKASKKYTALNYIQSMEPLLFILFPHEYVSISENSSDIKMAKASTICHIKQEAQKHNTEIVQKIKQQKKANSKSFSSISIMANCLEIYLISCDTELRIQDKNCSDMIKKVFVDISRGMLSIKLNDKRKIFYVYVPRKKYKTISLKTNTKRTFIDDASFEERFKAKELDIIAGKGITEIHGNYDYLSVQQNVGRILISGASKKTIVEGNETLVFDTIYHNEVNCIGDYQIRVNKGNIDLRCIKYKVKPKVNHLFKRVKKVDGVYSIGHKRIKLSLSTNNGSIFVK